MNDQNDDEKVEPFESHADHMERLDGVLHHLTNREPLGKGESARAKIADFQKNLALIFAETTNPTPSDLQSAIYEGDLEEVRRLLDLGISPNAPNSTGGTMLKSALVSDHHDIAALLRERVASYSLTEAALAGDVDHLATLLDTGHEQINRPDRTGDLALHLASCKGHGEAVRLLLARGADPNRRDKREHTSLASACQGGFPEIAHLLVKAGATVGIVEAAYLNDLPLLKRFLEDGADIETQDVAQKTPLLAASGCGHVEIVRFLLERGANLGFETSYEATALNVAIAQEHVLVIHLLMDYGANPNATNSLGSTLLMNAALFGRLRSVEALLARGADPNFSGQNDTGSTLPLHKCIFGSSLLSRLFPRETSVRIATALLNAGADIEARDGSGYTPLMRALSNGDANLVRLLLARGADVHASTRDGHATTLSCARDTHGPKDRRDKSSVITLIMQALGPEYAVYDAAERGDLKQLVMLLDADVPADQGIVLNPWRQDRTPLMAAATKGHTAIVRLLLARSDIRSSSKANALSSAEYGGHRETARLLRQAVTIHPTGSLPAPRS